MISFQPKGQSFSPNLRVHVVEEGDRSRKGCLRCEIEKNLKFNPNSLATYFFAEWDPVFYDLLLVAATVEFCDKILHRAVHSWPRHYDVRIPVHEPGRWNEKKVSDSLVSSLEFLTGDKWVFEFISRKKEVNRPSQCQLKLDNEISAVIPFSNGLDSLAVSRLTEIKLANRLVRVRIKSACNNFKRMLYDQPFTAIPYSVCEGKERFVESSARSRGFKFALVSGLAAFLSKADHVIVPESGQGALGPVLAPVGQIWEDYRSYPLFTDRMQVFFKELLGRKICYSYPQLWQTKGETLKEYFQTCKDPQQYWINTISCWQQSRQVSVNGKARQCGICAACMLRRLSIFVAGGIEPDTNYAWENLSTNTFEGGASPYFKKNKITKAMREYAIAGTLHLSQISGIYNSQDHRQMLEMRASELAKSLNLTFEQTIKNLTRFLSQHKSEWEQFQESLGSTSFVVKWARQVK